MTLWYCNECGTVKALKSGPDAGFPPQCQLHTVTLWYGETSDSVDMTALKISLKDGEIVIEPQSAEPQEAQPNELKELTSRVRELEIDVDYLNSRD